MLWTDTRFYPSVIGSFFPSSPPTNSSNQNVTDDWFVEVYNKMEPTVTCSLEYNGGNTSTGHDKGVTGIFFWKGHPHLKIKNSPGNYYSEAALRLQTGIYSNKMNEQISPHVVDWDISCHEWSCIYTETWGMATNTHIYTHLGARGEFRAPRSLSLYLTLPSIHSPFFCTAQTPYPNPHLNHRFPT